MNIKSDKQVALERTLQHLLELSKLHSFNDENDEEIPASSNNSVSDVEENFLLTQTVNPKFPVDASVLVKLAQIEKDNPLIEGYCFMGNQRIRIDGMSYEFFKGNEAPGREYFRCLGCRQFRDELKRQGMSIQELPLVGSIIWLHNGKLVGDPENPGGHPHCCGGKFVKTSRRRTSNPIKTNSQAIISTIPLESGDENPSTSTDMQISRQTSVPRIVITSELIPGHVYTFQRFQHIYQAKPPFTYFNCLDCKRLCASKGKHYIPKLRLTPDGEILQWGTADKPHNGAHYCLSEDILDSIGEANRIIQKLPLNKEFYSDANNEMDISTAYNNFKDLDLLNFEKPAKIPKYEYKDEKFELDRPTSSENSSVAVIESQKLSDEAVRSLQAQIDELREIVMEFQKSSGLAVVKKKICIVQKRSLLTKNVEVEDFGGIKETYPHSDVVVSIAKRLNPDVELSSDERRARKNDLEMQFLSIEERLKLSSIENLLLIDKLLIGLDESVLKNGVVVRAEFPTIPSLVKMVLNNAFVKPSSRLRSNISNIFFMLGYDMVRCFNEDSCRVIAKSIHTEIDDLFDILEDKTIENNNDTTKTKSIVFVTIPELGFLREKFEVFNATMRDKIKELQFYRRHAKIRLDILDWAKLVSKLNAINNVDERLQVLFTEMELKYGLKSIF